LTLPLSQILQHHIIHRSDEEDLQRFYNVDRDQYDAGLILQTYEQRISAERGIIFTSVDLYIPIFTYVFGLAKLNGTVAIVSSQRLRNEFYGLPKNDGLLQERLMKEAVHEFGHLCNLRHCDNYLCVMASSAAADDLDIKEAEFCSDCAAQLH
jgi:archaemetzincin